MITFKHLCVGMLAASALALTMIGCGSDLYGTWHGHYEPGMDGMDNDYWSQYGGDQDDVRLDLDKGGWYHLHSRHHDEDGRWVLNNDQIRLDTEHRDGDIVRDEPPHMFKVSGDHNNFTARHGSAQWNFRKG